jgi:hypothetical protein
MRLGETIATYDVGFALRGKSGKFEVTSAAGDTYDVICRPSHTVSNLEWSGNDTENAPFLIRKVAENVSRAETKATTATVSEEKSLPASSSLPFVVDHAVDEKENPGNIELLYLEDDSAAEPPLACVYLKSELEDHAFEAKSLMTSRCATFNELDSEIRRLEAKLDEIRSRAKKMFYKSQAIAASA